MEKKAVVIGSGFGGIAISLRLKKLGYDTTIIEKLDSLGGRARVFEVNGFKHDAGPTVITAPFLFDELFSLFGKKREDYLNFVPLEPWYRYYFHDGKTFDYCSTVEKTNSEISKFDKRDMLLALEFYRLADYLQCSDITKSLWDFISRNVKLNSLHEMMNYGENMEILCAKKLDYFAEIVRNTCINTLNPKDPLNPSGR